MENPPSHKAMEGKKESTNMSYFERKPEEKKGPIAEPLAKYEHGRFSMPDEEKKRKVKEAIAEGRDPEEALREHEERLAQANARLMEERKGKGR